MGDGDKPRKECQVLHNSRTVCICLQTAAVSLPLESCQNDPWRSCDSGLIFSFWGWVNSDLMPNVVQKPKQASHVNWKWYIQAYCCISTTTWKSASCPSRGNFIPTLPPEATIVNHTFFQGYLPCESPALLHFLCKSQIVICLSHKELCLKMQENFKHLKKCQ